MIIVELEGTLFREPADESLEGMIDGVMEELLSLDNVADASVVLNRRTGNVSTQVFLDLESWNEAVEAANNALRTAFHAVGVATPDWPIGRWSTADDIDADASATRRTMTSAKPEAPASR